MIQSIRNTAKQAGDYFSRAMMAGFCLYVIVQALYAAARYPIGAAICGFFAAVVLIFRWWYGRHRRTGLLQASEHLAARDGPRHE